FALNTHATAAPLGAASMSHANGACITSLSVKGAGWVCAPTGVAVIPSTAMPATATSTRHAKLFTLPPCLDSPSVVRGRQLHQLIIFTMMLLSSHDSHEDAVSPERTCGPFPCADRKGIESFSRRKAANLPHRVIDLRVDCELPQLHR